MEFAISEREERGVTVVAIRGDLDPHVSPSVQRVLKEVFDRGAERVLLDLTDVTFLDSTGIAAIVGGHAEAVEREARFVCVSGEGTVRKLEWTGLSGVIACTSDREEALALLHD